MYIIDKENVLFILINFKNENYRIFINDTDRHCHLWNSTEHISVVCDAVPNNGNNQSPLEHSFSPKVTENENESQRSEELTYKEKLEQAPKIAASRQQAKIESTPPTNLMDVDQKTPKRPGPSTEQCPPALNHQKPSRNKKHKNSATAMQTILQTKDRPNSSTDSQTKDVPPKPDAQDSENDSSTTDEIPTTLLSDILATEKSVFEEKSYQPPISFQDFSKFMAQCVKPKEARSIIREYSSGTAAFIVLLDKVYNTINSHKFKSRITQMKKALTTK